jgi:hypothetical protein
MTISIKEELQEKFKEKFNEILSIKIKESSKYAIDIKKHLLNIAIKKFDVSIGAEKTLSGKRKSTLKTLTTHLNAAKENGADVKDTLIDSLIDENLERHKERITKISQSLEKYRINIKKHLNMRDESDFSFDLLDSNSYEGIEDMFDKINRFGRVVKYGKSFVKSYKHLFEPKIIEKEFYKESDI